jgi:hypothetical protein
MATDLANTEASLDDSVNVARILHFREKFRRLLEERVDIIQVRGVLKSVENEQWDIISRDVWNAFYCCVAACRHAYRYVAIMRNTAIANTFQMGNYSCCEGCST